MSTDQIVAKRRKNLADAIAADRGLKFTPLNKRLDGDIELSQQKINAEHILLTRAIKDRFKAITSQEERNQITLTIEYAKHNQALIEEIALIPNAEGFVKRRKRRFPHLFSQEDTCPDA